MSKLRCKNDPLVINEEIENLRTSDGEIEARVVVRAAHNPKHKLHCEFEWSDKKAADLQRIARANELIRIAMTVVVIDKTRKIVAPTYVKNPHRPANESGMIDIQSETLEPPDRFWIMQRELNHIQAAVERARSIVEVLNIKQPGLMAQFEKLLAQIVYDNEADAA